MDKTETKRAIASGRTWLGIELGSTRIKAVLIDAHARPIASGEHQWENQFENGVWTYSIESVWAGLRTAYAMLASRVENEYGEKLIRVAAIGISAMMHGYLPLDAEGNPLADFRTWRNTITEKAAEKLSLLFNFNIPQRWSIAHLYQAMLNGESHVENIARLTTLAGYVHLKLTGKFLAGVGEASGMFPIDSVKCDYDSSMIQQFDKLAVALGYHWRLRDILPTVAKAGMPGGTLTDAGARMLDPSGALMAGIPFCPPEGDAGTGMVATNAVAPRTGNVSAGTSIFAMLVLEHALSRLYPEIDMVTTPDGMPVAMVHCNNCTNEINAWAEVFRGFCEAIGCMPDMGKILTAMFTAAIGGEADAGGLLLYNYLSGEPVTDFADGRPLFVRGATARLTFKNFMRAQLLSALATLRIGMDILSRENVCVERLLGHGGFFKTPHVGQSLMAAALNTPVSVMQTAGEGGPWGMALLAAYMTERSEEMSLSEYLDARVFVDQSVTTIWPDSKDIAGFAKFMCRYTRGLEIERTALLHLD